jgi:hypothetical protein
MADFEEPCYVGRHLLFVFFVGITQILLYAIGLPLLVFVFLHRHRHELKKPVVKFRYSLFFAGFRPEKYYWEVIVALRKESTVILAVFGPNMGTPMLAHVALLVFLVQILIQLIGHPYEARQIKLQILDVTSIIVCWFTMWSGFFFLGVKKEWDKSLLVLLTMVVLIINVVHMIVLVGSMIVEMFKENGGSGMLQNVRRRTSGMVPSSVKRFRERAKERKAQHRLSFDFENPTLGRNESTTIEMVSTSGFGMSGVELDGLNEGEVKVVEQGEVKVSGAGGATATKKKKNYLKTKRRSKVSRPEALPGGSIELVVKANDAQVSRRDRLRSLREKQHSLFSGGGGGAGRVKTNPMLKGDKKGKL